MKLTDLRHILSTEEIFIQFLLEKNLIKRPFNCGVCNSLVYMTRGLTRRNVNKIYKCPSFRCLKRYSIWEGSIFSMFNISAYKIMEILYLKSLLINNVEVSDQTDISRNVIIKIHKYITDKVANRHGVIMLGGENEIVEIDETHIVTRRDGRGRINLGERYWIIGCISRTTKLINMQVVRQRTKIICNNFINDHIAKGSVIMSDCWRGYIAVNQLGYRHETVNHSIEFVSQTNDTVHTQTIESLWNVYKSKLPQYKTFEDL